MQRLCSCALVLASAIASGCGGGGDEGRPLVVSAASSLTGALRSCAPGGARLQFGGSDQLAAQVRQGLRPDVLAAADVEVVAALHREGLVEEPSVFATNALVVAVPASGGRVRALRDLERDGVRLVVGAPSVPVGAATRRVLARLGAARERAILARVRSEEPDVKGVAGKLAQDAADAGFVYRTEVLSAGGRLRAITLPRALRPVVRYGAAVVRGARSPAAARAFLQDLREGRCAAALRAGGFGAPGGGRER